MKYFILIIAFLFIGCDTGRMEKLDKINCTIKHYIYSNLEYIKWRF